MTKRLNSITQTATFAWSPGSQPLMLATGTLTDDLSNSSKLEIFSLDLGHHEPFSSSFKVNTSSRFKKLAWSPFTSETSLGIIAGGMENGSLQLWDPFIFDKKSAENGMVLDKLVHSGSINDIDFNVLQPNLLASAGSKKEIYIWDLNNPNSPSTPGTQSPNMDDISSVAWNHQVPHILSTASTNGYTVIWDLRNKREIMTLTDTNQNSKTDQRGDISSIAWHPNVATQIITASKNDSNPVILLWDLRHAHKPEKTLSGHSQGVLDVSWCNQDPDLLVSSGKDCKTLCWNPNTGKLNGEVARNNTKTFEVSWCPRIPDLIATSSYESLNIYSIQGRLDSDLTESQYAAPDNSFGFTVAKPASFHLDHAPKWLRRPIGATFGFSGKLVTFSKKSVCISTIGTDPDIIKRSEQLESATELNSNIIELIDDRIDTCTDNKQEWQVLKSLFSDNAREELLQRLGLVGDQIVQAANALLEINKDSKSNTNLEAKAKATIREDSQKDKKSDISAASNLFGTSPTDDQRPGDSFFQKFQSSLAEDDKIKHTAPLLIETNNNQPFVLSTKESTEVDRLITSAILFGEFETAVNVCLATDRFSDALLLATCGGNDLLARTRKAYFERHSKQSPYLRLLEGITEENLASIIRDVDLIEWDSVLIVLCTFAQPKDFDSLCENFGDRLLQGKNSKLAKNAIIFYLAAGNFEKSSQIWITEFNNTEAALAESNVTSATALQELIEKIMILQKAIEFKDNVKVNERGEFVLAGLYHKYLEYAELMATQGKLTTALKYVSLIPAQYTDESPVASRDSVLRDRVFHASPSHSTSQYSITSFPYERKILSSRQNPDIQQENNIIEQQTYNSYQTTAETDFKGDLVEPVSVYVPTKAIFYPPKQHSPYFQQLYDSPHPPIPTKTAMEHVNEEDLTKNTVGFIQYSQQQILEQTAIQEYPYVSSTQLISKPFSPVAHATDTLDHQPKPTVEHSNLPIYPNPTTPNNAPADNASTPFKSPPVGTILPFEYSTPLLKAVDYEPIPPSSIGSTRTNYFSARQPPPTQQAKQQLQSEKTTTPLPPINAMTSPNI